MKMEMYLIWIDKLTFLEYNKQLAYNTAVALYKIVTQINCSCVESK